MFSSRIPSSRRATLQALALAATALVAVLTGCTNGNGGARPAPPPTPSQDPGPGPAAARTPVAATAFTSFPAVSLDGLSPEQQAAFAKMANEEICPCDCPKSWGACLQDGTRCQSAVLLAEWVVGQLAEGVEADIIAEQVTGEIGGYSSKPASVKTDGYASKGAKNPRYTLVEYADFECAHCKMASGVVSELVRRHGDKVRVVYKHFPLSFHPNARPAAVAAEAAGEQGRFWEMHDAIFATQNMIDDELLVGHAKALGLDVARWQQDRQRPEITGKVDSSRQEGEAVGVEATPTFLVNGRPFNLMRTLDAFELRFAMEDARATSSCQ